MRNSKQSSGTSSSTSVRTLRVLKFLSLCSSSIAIGEIARSLGEERNAVRRSVQALSDEGLVYKEPCCNKYKISASVKQLTHKFSEPSDSMKLIKEYLVTINDVTGELTTYDTMESNFIVIDDFCDVSRHEKLDIKIGDKIPAHCSSAGRIMAAKNFQKAVPIISRSLEKFTDRTITDQVNFLDELKNAEEKGFAYCQDEWVEGISCVGSAIQNSNGRVESGISVGGNSARFTNKYCEDIGDYLKVQCIKLSQELQKYSA